MFSFLCIFKILSLSVFMYLKQLKKLKLCGFDWSKKQIGWEIEVGMLSHPLSFPPIPTCLLTDIFFALFVLLFLFAQEAAEFILDKELECGYFLFLSYFASFTTIS